jgi:hypothetical protein
MDAGEMMAGGLEHAETLARALAATPGVDAWQAAVTRREEAQLYLIGEREEARRVVTDATARITIHNLHAPHAPPSADGAEAPDGAAGGQALGLTTFSALPDDFDNPEALVARLHAATQIAGLTDNQPFALPSPPSAGYPAVEVFDPDLAGDMGAALDEAALRLRAAVAATPGLRLGSAEFFAARELETLRTSAGVRASQPATTVFFDLILLAGEGERATEFHAELRRRRLQDLHIERIVAAYGAFALHSLGAVPPPTYRGPVVVSGEAAGQLFNPLFFQASPFAAHTSARMKHQRMGRFTPGELVTPEEPRGDKLTLVSDPTRPWGVRTAAFDGDGLPAQAVTLIEDGVFRRFWADARYGAYLDVDATGEIGNLTVGLGTTPMRALTDPASAPAGGGAVYEVAAFSWFNPDVVTGDFSAEIRLGYQHDASGVTPIKGGALTGNLFAAFGDATFSAEPFTDGVYYGPAAIRFNDIIIAGGE